MGLWECAAYVSECANWRGYDEHMEEALPLFALCPSEGAPAAESESIESSIVGFVRYKKVPFLLSARAFVVASAVRELRSNGGAGQLRGLLIFGTGDAPALRATDGRAANAMSTAAAAGAIAGRLRVAGWLLRPVPSGGVIALYAADLELVGSPAAYVCSEVAKSQAACPTRLAAIVRRLDSLKPSLARGLPPAGRPWFEQMLAEQLSTVPTVRLNQANSAIERSLLPAGGRLRALSMPWGGCGGGKAADAGRGGALAGGTPLSPLLAATALVLLGSGGVLWHAALLITLPGLNGGSGVAGALTPLTLALACVPLGVISACAVALALLPRYD
mmetsp:Transcript_29252/g.67117  ORF Transcript_29252/g.67117 Transcript_29252/m.67117 type:complete len:332 (-) Transcript_29252:66-1061(-)